MFTLSIVVLPSTTSPVPTRVPFAYTSTGPFGTFAPVVLSVIFASIVTLPAVLLVNSATVVLSRFVTSIGKSCVVALYVSFPG